ncbi:MAG: NAD(P)-dependent glycerol-3-phosphate dehydrogenase [Oscillospiraceae bacterium]|nr:NAD(P)-dependent glycerol-3-phosphate dehydrogenase [Oscillospiraceae bacterium]
MKVTVLGSGGWGTALSNLLSENGHSVTLWSYTRQESEMLQKTRENPLLKGVSLHPNIAYTSDFTSLASADLIVMATPSFAVRKTAEAIVPHLAEGTPIVSVTKGVEAGTDLRMTQIIAEVTHHPVAALSGPSHAEEVGRGIPTGCVAAAEDANLAELVQDAFMSPRFRVYTSSDIVGVELGAALKNVVALCAGVLDGMGCGDNTKALMMTRGLAEMARLGIALGGRRETFAGLTGVGDLIVTCTSMHSRNRRAGILIGQGKTPEEAMKEVGAVVEGYYAAKSARELAQKAKVSMPLVQEAYAVLYEGRAPTVALENLMQRDRCREIEYGDWEK